MPKTPNTNLSGEAMKRERETIKLQGQAIKGRGPHKTGLAMGSILASMAHKDIFNR
jgi:hypothetical protein